MNDHRGIPEKYFWTEDNEKAFQKGWDTCKSELAASLSRVVEQAQPSSQLAFAMTAISFLKAEWEQARRGVA